MRRELLLGALFCFLSLSGCGAVATHIRTHPVACGVDSGAEAGLSAYLRRLIGTQVETKKNSVSIIIPSDSLFQPDAAGVKISNPTDLDVLAKAGKRYHHMRIGVNVYTDCAHSEEQDLALSELEAWLIKRALVDRGIPMGRVSARGWGESWPVASNATADGRKANRRVRITFEPKKS